MAIKYKRIEINSGGKDEYTKKVSKKVFEDEIQEHLNQGWEIVHEGMEVLFIPTIAKNVGFDSFIYIRWVSLKWSGRDRGWIQPSPLFEQKEDEVKDEGDQ